MDRAAKVAVRLIVELGEGGDAEASKVKVDDCDGVGGMRFVAVRESVIVSEFVRISDSETV